jgi:1-deoxyxylulose-5-phosphate synthase
VEYRYLGKSGLRVSVIGLGTNALGSRADDETSVRIVHDALDVGINFLDTADIYSNTRSEEMIGKALVGRRHEAVIATKAGQKFSDAPNDRGSSRRHLFHQVDESLKRLQTDYIDLYQIHTFDRFTPLEETLSALDDLVRSGKVRYIGASNYYAWELMKALAISEARNLARFISIQPSYSLVDRLVENELVPLCQDQGVGLIPYFPLASGILSGKYSGGAKPEGSRGDTMPSFNRYLSDAPRMAVGDAVVELAKTLNLTPSALSLAWLMQQPAVSTIIVGARKPEQLRENASAADVTLDATVIQTLNELTNDFKFSRPFAQFRV